MTSARIIYITGGPGSGKSTTARRLAEHFPESFHLRVDELREGMVRGFVAPTMPFSEVVRRQFRTARRAAAAMAATYADAGITFVIDDTIVPEDFAAEYRELFSDPRAARFMLIADGTTMVARMRERRGPFDEFLIGLGADMFTEHLAQTPKDGFTLIDNNALTVDETVAAILGHLGVDAADGDAPVANGA